MDMTQFQGSIGALQELALTWGPKILSALVILVVAHFIAKAVKWGLAAVFNRLPFARTANAGADKDETMGARLGEIGYWLVWLVGLIATLNTLGLNQVVAPLSRLVNGFFAFMPNVVGAGIIFFVGWIVAMVCRRVVGSTVAAMPVAELTTKIGFKGVTNVALAKAAAQVTFLVIIIPVAIAGLEALQIKSISDPAVAVLGQILNTLPKLILASAILGISFVISKWVVGLIEQTLPTLGFDNSIKQLGLFPDAAEGTYPATKAAGWIASTAIMLFAAIEAAKALGFTQASDILYQILELGGKIGFGGVIIAAGFALANIIGNALSRSGGETAGFASSIARWATIALSTAMGLRFMGIADDIITLAFGLILGAAAVACAIAFGVGGRAAAARLLDRWIK
jgi:Conserved TM helix